jgi:hypothetical protein
MQIIKNVPIFRIFSATHRNQSESINHKAHSTPPLKAPTLFSNAEKMRKIECRRTNKSTLELSRTIRSNGLTILFSYIPHCSKLSNSIRGDHEEFR